MSRSSISYPSLHSAVRPVLHSDDIPVPTPPAVLPESDADSEASTSNEDDSDYEPEVDSKKPHLIGQGELNDLVRDLMLTKGQAELLASRLQNWNLLASDTTVTAYRKRTRDIVPLFSNAEDLCYCNDVEALFGKLSVPYDPS